MSWRLASAACEVAALVVMTRILETFIHTAVGASPFLYWALFDAALLCLIIAVRVGAGGWELKDIGLTAKLPRDVAAGVVGFSLGRLVASPVEILILDARASALANELAYEHPLVATAAAVLVTFPADSLPKELFFRGYTQGLLERASSWALAAAASATSFSLSYAAWGADLALATLPDSAMLSLTYALTGSLVPVLVYHSLLNAAWAAEVAVYASAGRVFGFTTVAAVFTLSLLALAALHKVGTEVFVLGMRKLSRPTRRDIIAGGLVGLALSAVYFASRVLDF